VGVLIAAHAGLLVCVCAWYVCACVCARACVCLCAPTHPRACVCLCARACVCLCACVHARWVGACVCVCAWYVCARACAYSKPRQSRYLTMSEEEKRAQDAAKWRPFLDTYAKRIRCVDGRSGCVAVGVRAWWVCV
jgi:hypothetical protein